MKVTKKDIGKRCRVQFSDAPHNGQVDVMILGTTEEGESWDVFNFAWGHINCVDPDEVVEIGDFIKPR